MRLCILAKAFTISKDLRDKLKTYCVLNVTLFAVVGLL